MAEKGPVVNIEPKAKSSDSEKITINLGLVDLQTRAMAERFAGSAKRAVAMDLARTALIAAAMALSLSTMAVEEYNPFIYFRF